MAFRLCPSDPLLDLVRRRFDGLNVLGTPTPSLRPLTVVALRRRDAIELGALAAMVEDPSPLLASAPVEEEALPDLAAQSTQRFDASFGLSVLPGLLGAFGADASALASAGQRAEFSLRFGGVRALRIDRARLGEALRQITFRGDHPHFAWLTEPGVRFTVVDRVIVADEVEVTVHRARSGALSASGPSPQLGAQLNAGLSGQQEQQEVIRSAARAPVVLAWSSLTYRVGLDGRVGEFRGEVNQMGGGAGGASRDRPWGADEAGEVQTFGAPARPTPDATPSGALSVTVEGELLFRTGPLQPRADGQGGETGQYGPTYTTGPADFWTGSERVGVSYTAAPSSGVTHEDMLMFRRSSGSTYPNLAPITGEGTRSAVTVDQSSSGFASRSDFLSGAWSELSPPGSTTVYHARVSARRYTVDDVGKLSTALSGAQGSQWVDKLVERDGSNQIVNTGWVYVEVLTYDGTIHRKVHQFTPASMALPPGSNSLTLEPASNMSIGDVLSTYVSSGWKYAYANVDASVVTGGPLTAGLPGAPPSWGEGEGVTAN